MPDESDTDVAAATDGTAVAAELEELGFVEVGHTRGARTWAAGVNRYLQFTVIDEGTSLLVTWRCDLGEFMLARGWQIGGAETSFQELYPQRDVRVARSADAVAAELRRTLGALRLDLGDPSL